MKLRQQFTAALATASVLAATTACQPDPIAPSPPPTAEETSASPSPTPSVSPTPSFEPDEREAIAEVERAFAAWISVTDRLKASANKLTEKQRSELYEVGGDPAADDMNDFLIRYGKSGIVQRGELEILSTTPVEVRLQVPRGDYPEVRLRACVDNSDVKFVYASTGKPASSSVGEPRFVMPVKAWLYRNAWHIVEAGTSSEREGC